MRNWLAVAVLALSVLTSAMALKAAVSHNAVTSAPAQIVPAPPPEGY